MKLFLVRHGKYNSAELDPTKGLSVDGKKDITKIGKYLKNAEFDISQIFHSEKQRAKDSADILGEVLKISNISQMRGISPLDDPEEVIVEIESVAENLMLVSHLPFVDRLASLLLSKKLNFDMFEFRQGTVLILEKGVKWRVVCMVSPDNL